MTAEIAIMNSEAIALATDSAVTITQEKGHKVFTSANKLFALSKYCPVGIMVYGSAKVMGIPWETVIKIYRSGLGKRKFNTLKEYADNFITFLDNNNTLFPETEQEKYLYGSIFGYFGLLRKNIEEKVRLIIKRKRKIEYGQVKQITSDVIKEHYDKLENAEMLPSIPKNHIKNITTKYGHIIDKVRKSVFEKWPMSSASLKQLKKIAASIFSKNVFQADISGVVIAGFGVKDTFPSLKSFGIEGIVNNKLKYKKYLSAEINFKNAATIIPFAQGEMVATFMEGIDPYLQAQMIDGRLSEIFNRYPEIIVENIKEFNASEKSLLKQKLKNVSNRIFQEYKESMNNYEREKHVDPVIRIVAMLPKDELATMAESLVSLTIFKLRVTGEPEQTVAGPIDVAVISKGDGFVWIKRKHYFKPELNPQFFANYNRR